MRHRCEASQHRQSGLQVHDPQEGCRGRPRDGTDCKAQERPDDMVRGRPEDSHVSMQQQSATQLCVFSSGNRITRDKE